VKVETTTLPGVIVFEPDVYHDERGFLLESYSRKRYAEVGLAVDFVQDNHSSSTAGTLRGLHAQLQFPQGKLVRALEGAIFDVAIDIRVGSPTFRQWYGATLSAENFRQLYIPPGFAHGFAVTSERAQVEYKCTEFYAPGDEITISWSDPEIGIEWPSSDPVLSDRDRHAQRLSELMDRLPRYEGD